MQNAKYFRNLLHIRHGRSLLLREVAQNAQAHRAAFFRVKLHRPNVPRPHHAAEGYAVIGHCGDYSLLFGNGKVGVYKIHMRAFVYSLEEGIASRKVQNVPPDVRYLQRLALPIGQTFGKAHHFAPQDAQPALWFRAARFLADLKQQLKPQAYS